MRVALSRGARSSHRLFTMFGLGDIAHQYSIYDMMASDTEVNGTEQPAPTSMSKSQLKKLLKRQKWLDGRGERRKQEREKRKLKRREAAKARDQSSDAVKPKKKKLMSESDNKFRIVIDMDFEDYMTEQEITKAVLQVGRIYSINRHADNPCQLYVSSLKGKILDKMTKTNVGYKNWDINCTEKSYLELFEQDQDCGVQSNIIYLSGDSDSNLPEVDEVLKDQSKVYVIGGLVDHNRHKNLCQNRARERNIPTAKLPIKEHVKLSQRHILSTVTVFEILLKVLGDKMEWVDSFKTCIPKRKLAPSDDDD